MDVKVYRNKNKFLQKQIASKNHLITIGFLMLFIAGSVVGAIMIRFQSPISDLIVSMFRKYNGLVVSNGVLKNFLELLTGNGSIVLILYFLGMSAIGSPMICMASFAKGIGMGIVASYLYKTYQLSGFGYCMLIFFPQQVIIMLALFIAMNESYVNSKMIFKSVTNNSHGDFDIRLYTTRFLFVSMIVIVTSFVGSILNTFISGIFLK